VCDFLFADVTNGLPTTELLAAAGGEDEFAGYAESPQQAPVRQDEPPPAQRTARRRRAAVQTASPAAAATPGQHAAAEPPAAQAAAGEASLLPLPGDEEPPDPAAGREQATASPPSASGDDRHRKLVGVVQAHFKRLGFADEDRDERLWAAGKLASVQGPESLNDLDPDELSIVADTLAKCRDRKRLEEIMAAAGEGGSDG